MDYRALPVDSTPYQYERFDYNQPLSGLYYNNIANPVDLFDRMANMGMGLTPRPTAANAMPGSTLSAMGQVIGNPEARQQAGLPAGALSQDQIKALAGQMGSYNDMMLANKASTSAVRDAAQARLAASQPNAGISTAYTQINNMDGYNRDVELAKELYPVLQASGLNLSDLASIPDQQKAEILDNYYRGLQEKNQLPPRGIMDSLAGKLAIGGLFSAFGAPLLSGLMSGTGLAASTLGGYAKSALDFMSLGQSGLAGGFNPGSLAGTAANYSRAAANAVPGGSTGITTPTGGGIVGSGQLNPAGVGIMGNTAYSGIPLAYSPLAGGAIAPISTPSLNPANVVQGKNPANSVLGDLAKSAGKNLATNALESLLAPPQQGSGGMMSPSAPSAWGINPYNKTPYPELFMRPRSTISNQLVV